MSGVLGRSTDMSRTTGILAGQHNNGNEAFCAGIDSEAWVALDHGGNIPFNNVSAFDWYDNGNNFNTSTYQYIAPRNGTYIFNSMIYTANSDTVNGFGFRMGTGQEMSFVKATSNIMTHAENADDKTVHMTAIVDMAKGDQCMVFGTTASDYYTGQSYISGCLLSSGNAANFRVTTSA